MLVRVKKVPVTEFMSEKAVRIVEAFNRSGNTLYLLIHPGHDLSTLEDEGMYDFLFNPEIGDLESAKLCGELNEVLEYMFTAARPVFFSKEDIEVVLVSSLV